MIKILLLVLISASPVFAQYHSGTITAKSIVLSTGTSEIGTIGFSTVTVPGVEIAISSVAGGDAVGTMLVGGRSEDGKVYPLAGYVGHGEFHLHTTSIDEGVQHVSQGEGYSFTTEINLASAGTEVPVSLFINLSTSTKTIFIHSFIIDNISKSGDIVVRFYSNPTVVSSGTATSSVCGRVGIGCLQSSGISYYLPSTSSFGSKMSTFSVGNGGTFIRELNNMIVIIPGGKFLITGTPTANNTILASSMLWVEISD